MAEEMKKQENTEEVAKPEASEEAPKKGPSRSVRMMPEREYHPNPAETARALPQVRGITRKSNSDAKKPPSRLPNAVPIGNRSRSGRLTTSLNGIFFWAKLTPIKKRRA